MRKKDEKEEEEEEEETRKKTTTRQLLHLRNGQKILPCHADEKETTKERTVTLAQWAENTTLSRKALR